MEMILPEVEDLLIEHASMSVYSSDASHTKDDGPRRMPQASHAPRSGEMATIQESFISSAIVHAVIEDPVAHILASEHTLPSGQSTVHVEVANPDAPTESIEPASTPSWTAGPVLTQNTMTSYLLLPQAAAGEEPQAMLTAADSLVRLRGMCDPSPDVHAVWIEAVGDEEELS